MAHIDVRMTDKEYQRKYYLAHKEEILKKHKEYYEYSKEFQQKSREEYRKAHKEDQKHIPRSTI